jgi:2,3-bisphosphoglycerate-independent phosphoglycerate mutase
MKSKEITEKMLSAMASGKYQFLRCNFPNGDMVGHTGVMDAVVYAMECVDNSLKAIKDAADQYGYTLLITADHGNADQMIEITKGKEAVRTAHSLNAVPFIIYDKERTFLVKDGAFGLANVAPTVAKLLGLTAPECWEESII